MQVKMLADVLEAIAKTAPDADVIVQVEVVDKDSRFCSSGDLLAISLNGNGNVVLMGHDSAETEGQPKGADRA